jgi:hypothetical protein
VSREAVSSVVVLRTAVRISASGDAHESHTIDPHDTPVCMARYAFGHADEDVRKVEERLTDWESRTSMDGAQKHFGGRLWRPPNVLPVALTYFFFAAFLVAFFAAFLAAFFVAMVSILPFRCDIESAALVLQLTKCIELCKNHVKKKITFRESLHATLFAVKTEMESAVARQTLTAGEDDERERAACR